MLACPRKLTTAAKSRQVAVKRPIALLGLQTKSPYAFVARQDSGFGPCEANVKLHALSTKQCSCHIGHSFFAIRGLRGGEPRIDLLNSRNDDVRGKSRPDSLTAIFAETSSKPRIGDEAFERDAKPAGVSR